METNKSNQSINLNKDSKTITNLVDNAKPLQIPATSTDNRYYNSNKVMIVADDDNNVITIIDNSGKYRTSHKISITAAKVLADYINYRYNNSPESEAKDDNNDDGCALTKHELIKKLKEVTDELESVKAINDNMNYNLNKAIVQRNDACKVITKLEEGLDIYKTLISNIMNIIESNRCSLTNVINQIDYVTNL